MSKTDKETGNIEKALTAFGQIIVDDRKELKKGMEVLTKSVNELLLSDVEARKEREYESKRAERMEGNQKEQGGEIKNISDTLLIHTGKIDVLESKQSNKDKIKVGLFITLGAAFILIMLKIIGPLL